MIKIPSHKLSPSTVKHLDAQQAAIDGLASYEERVQKAKSLWNNKDASKVKKAAFEEIKEVLKKLAIGKQYCNYCEHCEAYDIEHIFPKSLFPNKAFQWENYLYACKACNIGEKLARFKVFDPTDPKKAIDITPANKSRNYIQPPSEDNVLINPRTENPMELLWLDLGRGVLVLHPEKDTPRNQAKVEYTIELLQLNSRGLSARKNARIFFWNALKAYCNIQQATSIEDLKTVAQKYSPVDEFVFKDLQTSRQNISNHIKTRIQTHHHQTVWEELKRQRDKYEKLDKLFKECPETLNW